MRRHRRVFLVVVLLPLVLTTLGFASDTQTVYEGIEPYPNISKSEAIQLAAADPDVREELSRHGPHTSEAEYGNGGWTVHFQVEESGVAGGMLDKDREHKEVARVGVDDRSQQLNYVWTGDQVEWQMARGDDYSYGKQANYWYVWEPLALLFCLAFCRLDKLFSLRNLDVFVLLSFLLSHGFFRAGDSYVAVLLWYPPLLYLLIRTLLMGFGVGERVEKTSNFPTVVLVLLAGLANGLILALNVFSSSMFDAGFAGVAGADLIINGALPYGNGQMHNSAYIYAGPLDTYGPLNYLLYVPFVWLFGWSGVWNDQMPAAKALTCFGFVGVALALMVAGWRYAGTRGAAALLFAWTVFPYTLYETNNNSNDLIVAMVLAIGLAMAGSPVARGASVAAGFGIKLFPIALAPLWILHDGRRRTHILGFIFGGLSVILLSFWVLALNGDPVGGAKLFYEKTVAFQGTRETPWTIFTQVPGLAFLQWPLVALAILLAFLFAVIPKKRTVRRLAALSVAVVIAFQLTSNYWFYFYIIWFEPFVFLALLLATNEKTALDGKSDQLPGRLQHDP